MSTNRAMAFVDGENITMRYQAMLTGKSIPLLNNICIPDVLAWNPSALSVFPFLEIIRATYYTYAVGTDEQLSQWATQIKGINYTYRSDKGSFTYAGYLYPKVFKKIQKSAKRKGVDISITVDSLTHAHNNDIDIVILMTGDGDYKPLIEEIMRRGKRVYLAAFSDGLNPILPNLVDSFFCLDQKCFEQSK
ncbi:MAG TPA: NYN domain-containing protein [Pyrinomonadaceae bacterium]|jgi:uncharacterized LabA/DUF88 family protein|nr:NYN domain-containing protein [Pyrinomonadaceae bacterium]